MDSRFLNIIDIGGAIALVKKIPGTAAARAEAAQVAAEAAQTAAEAAATTAEQHNMGVSVSGTTIIFTPNTGA